MLPFRAVLVPVPAPPLTDILLLLITAGMASDRDWCDGEGRMSLMRSPVDGRVLSIFLYFTTEDTSSLLPAVLTVLAVLAVLTLLTMRWGADKVNALFAASADLAPVDLLGLMSNLLGLMTNLLGLMMNLLGLTDLLGLASDTERDREKEGSGDLASSSPEPTLRPLGEDEFRDCSLPSSEL